MPGMFKANGHAIFGLNFSAIQELPASIFNVVANQQDRRTILANSFR